MAKKKQLNNNFVTISIVTLLVIGGATLGGLYWDNRNNHNMNGMSMDSGQMSYAVNLMSGKSYKSGQPTTLHFEVKQDGKTFKDFAIDSTKLMHLIVVRNDRSNFPRLAFDESSKITQELKATGISTSAKLTPLVNDAAKLRPDLWDAVAKLKIHTGWKCSQQQTACAEVELVHAGNEFNQQQWRHAKPYVQIAEDLIGNAQKTAEACNPASTAKAAPPSVRP